MHAPPMCRAARRGLQIWILEKDGGSLVGGALKLFQDRRKNPPPQRDPRLPPKPKARAAPLSLIFCARRSEAQRCQALFAAHGPQVVAQHGRRGRRKR